MDAVEPLAESEAFVDVLAYFSDTPILGIFTGLVLTVIIQSSSAMVGILQALSSTGVITFELVYPMIMGINLGTCVTTITVRTASRTNEPSAPKNSLSLARMIRSWNSVTVGKRKAGFKARECPV